MVKEIFIECFEKNKNSNQILNEKDITSLRRGFISGVFGKWGNFKLQQEKYQKDIIFGLKSGIVFYEEDIMFIIDANKVITHNYSQVISDNIYNEPELEYIVKSIDMAGKDLSVKCRYDWDSISLTDFDYEFFKLFFKCYNLKLKEENKKKLARNKKIKENKKIKLRNYQNKILNGLDKDGNGIVDDIQDNNDFALLLKKHQKVIVEIDRNYVKEFVKVSGYLKTKKKNIQLIFNSIKDTSNQKEVNNYVRTLKNEIHSYNVILYNSLNMVVSLIEDDMITFYEIHDSFDKLNMFNSNWENEVAQKLSNIGEGLDSLMYSVNRMAEDIIQEIGHLSYVTEESNRMLSNQLQEIDSSIQVNNLFTGIQTYQMYKINKNTKSLRS